MEINKWYFYFLPIVLLLGCLCSLYVVHQFSESGVYKNDHAFVMLKSIEENSQNLNPVKVGKYSGELADSLRLQDRAISSFFYLMNVIFEMAAMLLAIYLVSLYLHLRKNGKVYEEKS